MMRILKKTLDFLDSLIEHASVKETLKDRTDEFIKNYIFNMCYHGEFEHVSKHALMETYNNISNDRYIDLHDAYRDLARLNQVGEKPFDYLLIHGLDFENGRYDLKRVHEALDTIHKSGITSPSNLLKRLLGKYEIHISHDE